MAVGMAITEACKIVVVIVILFYYSWAVALFTAVSMAPGIVSTRLAVKWMQNSG